MSVAAFIRDLMAKGFTMEQALSAAESMEAASLPVLTARQARNRRYYENKKATKASEKRLKASETSNSDDQDALPSPEGSSPPPPSPKPLSSIPPSPPKGGSSPIDEAIEVYSEQALKAGLPVPRKITPDRRRQIDARLREHGGEAWGEACRRMAASAFCRGENDRGWRADLDFLLQPKSFNRLIEGKYDDRPTARAGPVSHQPQDFNSILDAMQGKPHVPQHSGPTIDASYERRDRSGVADIVQFHAVSARR